MKKIIICGAGEAGQHTAEVLSEQGHNITLIDVSSQALRSFEERVDVRTLKGSSCHAETLREAGVEKTDLLVAATDQDEINLLTAAIAKRMGATKVIARIHHRAYLDRSTLDYSKYLDVDHLICPELLTALTIARSLRNPGSMAIERFAQDKIEMQQFAVGDESEAVGKTLSELRLPPGIRLATIERGGQAFMPNAGSKLLAGDVVAVIGEARYLENVSKVLHPRKQKTRSVVIMGGSSMAVWLARALGASYFSLRLFETDRQRAEELSSKLSYVTVLQADPTDPAVFKEEHLEDCNAFVAVSDDDEHNILGALQAKALGAPFTVVVIQQPTYLPLLSQLGIDRPYSPRIVVAKEVSRLVDDSPVKRLATLAAGVAEVYELEPTAKGAAVNKPLKDIKLPTGAFVAAVQRGSKVHVPGAEDVIQGGDVLIVIGSSGIEKSLRELFVGK